MKAKLLLSTLLLAGWGLASAQDATPTRFECIADGWLRNIANPTFNTGGVTVELGYDDNNGQTYKRAALFGFEYKLPVGMKVEKATLYLISERQKSGQVQLYGYTDFSESSKFADEWEKASALYETEPLMTFTSAGQNEKTITQVSDEKYQTLESWTNVLDVTGFVRSLDSKAKMASFMLTGTGNNNNRFYTKENEGATGALGINAELKREDLLPYLEVTFVEDAASSTEKLLPVADTYIRDGGNAGNAYGEGTKTQGNMEIGGEGMLGLMSFSLPSEVLDTDKYELTDATLRLVITQSKGDSKVYIYGYGNVVEESTTWNKEQSGVEEALKNKEILTFDKAGKGGQSIGDDKVDYGEQFTKVDGWTNIIDLSDYVKGLVSEGSSSVNLLIKWPATNGNIRIATKETDDIYNTGNNTNKGTPFTFYKEDLVPQLTITYTKTTKGILEIDYGWDTTSQSKHPQGESGFDFNVVTAYDNAIMYVTAPEGSEVYYTYTLNKDDNGSQDEADSINGTNSRVKAKVDSDDVHARAETPQEGERTKAEESFWVPGTHEVILPASLTEQSGTVSVTYVMDGDESTPATYTFKTVKGSDDTIQPDGVEAIGDDAEKYASEYFTLEGIKVANPQKGGIYIVRQGNTAKKVIL